MAVHQHSTRTPGRRLLRGGDAPGRLLSTDELIALLGSRENIEETVERLLSALDEDDGEADLEPTLGSPEAVPHLAAGTIDQTRWAQGNSLGRLDEVENENEHGVEQSAEAREVRRGATRRQAAFLPLKEGILIPFMPRGGREAIRPARF